MEVNMINIGNAKGIRLPKTILKQYNISDTIEMILEKDRIILKQKSTPKKGWDKAFEQRHVNGDDSLKINDIFEDETFTE